MDIKIYNKAIITTWQVAIDKLKEQIASLDQLSSMNAIERGQKKQSLQEQIDSLNADVVKGNQFLYDLEYNPRTLVKKFSDNILEKLKKYATSHKKLPIQILMCLYKLDEKLVFIIKPKELDLNNPAIRIQYLQLCALVQNMLQTVQTAGDQETDPDFIKLLEDLLESTYIAIEGDLPDEMRKGQTTTNYWNDLKQDYDLFPNRRQFVERHLKDFRIAIEGTLPDRKQASHTAAGDSELTPPPELREEQLPTGPELPVTTDSVESTPSPEEQYGIVLKKLQTRSIVKNTLQTKIDRTVNAVDEEVRAKKQRKDPIDYISYNQLLAHLWGLSNSKTNTEAATFIAPFTKLTADVIDTSSLGKKIAGAILAIVGILLIAASIATLVATFGGSSLVSSVGIAFGISLLSSQIVLSTTAGVAAVAGAGLTFWGINKFKEGQGRELSKAIYEVNEELTHLSPTPAPK